MSYLRWEQVWLPRRLMKDRIDVFHAPANFGLPAYGSFARVLTLHDLIGRERVKVGALLRRGAPIELSHRIAARRADHIVTVSKYSLTQLLCHRSIERERVSVIYEAADPDFRPMPRGEGSLIRQRYGLERPYFLYVGGFETRKNVNFLIESFSASEIAGVDLILVGADGPNHQRNSVGTVASGSIRHLGYLPDGDLPAVYSGALAFVYPSLDEGFGLQLCEAMACGTPVLVAKGSSLTEVAGAAALDFDPRVVESLVVRLRSLATEEGVRQHHAQLSLERAREFSWSRATQETVAAYRSAIRRRRANNAFNGASPWR